MKPTFQFWLRLFFFIAVFGAFVSLAMPATASTISMPTSGMRALSAPLSLGVGGCAVVSTGGIGLNVRSGPGINYSIVGGLSDGTVVKITGGPSSGSGYTWWQHDHGGWSISNSLVDTSCPGGGGGGGSSGNIQLTEGLSINPSSPQVNQSTNAHYKAKNNGGSSITLGHLGVKCRRNSDNASYDFNWNTNVTLNPGQEFTYDANRNFDPATSFWCTPNYEKDGNWNDVKWSNGSTNYVTINVQNAPPPTSIPRDQLPTTSNPTIGSYYRLPVAVDTRPANSFSSTPYAHLNSGTVVKIVDGPRDAEGVTWWDLSETEWGGGTGWFTMQSQPPTRDQLPTTSNPTVGSYYRLPVPVDTRPASSFSSTPYAHLNSGTVIKIIGGPRDQEGVTWWDLSEEEWGGGTGWFTMQSQPPTRDQLPTTSDPTVGSYYRLPIAVDTRPASSFSSTPYAHLNSGTVVKIIDGPRDAEGVTWWDLSEEEWGSGTGWFTMQNQPPMRDQLPTTSNPTVGSYYRLPVAVDTRPSGSFSSTPYAHLNSGLVVKIIGGPRYQENATWWDLSEEEWGGGTGWFTMQSAPPTRDQLPTTSNPTVYSYYRLPIAVDSRSASSFSSAPYAHLNSGTVVKIIGGPRDQERATWWNLSEQEWGGSTGWFTIQDAPPPTPIPPSPSPTTPSPNQPHFRISVSAAGHFIYDGGPLSDPPSKASVSLLIQVTDTMTGNAVIGAPLRLSLNNLQLGNTDIFGRSFVSYQVPSRPTPGEVTAEIIATIDGREYHSDTFTLYHAEPLAGSVVLS